MLVDGTHPAIIKFCPLKVQLGLEHVDELELVAKVTLELVHVCPVIFVY